MHVIWGNLAIHALKNSRRVFDNQENFRLRGQAGGPGPYRYARLFSDRRRRCVRSRKQRPDRTLEQASIEQGLYSTAGEWCHGCSGCVAYEASKVDR